MSFLSFSKGLVSAIGLTCVSSLSIAESAPAPVLEGDFPSCIARLQQQAIAGGVSKATSDSVLGTIQPLERILKYDRNQPEFVQTFTGYFSKRVNDWRVTKGREKLKLHRAFLQELTKQHGVPGHYLVSFWGLETNFGAYKGKIPTLRALTTMACDQRRSEYFSQELVQALLLLEREGLNPEQMVGSWAGAMGHTQFMPTAYIKYAIDGDGDGKVDLWNNEKDALASAANFVKNLGWQPGYRWGREVKLPDDFDYQLAGKTNAKPLSFWHQQGLTKVDGSAIGEGELMSSLLIPAGHKGSAFLIYPNFDVILRWNNSEYYGIAVGHLADRIAGAGGLSKPLPDLPKYTREQMKTFQENLNQQGFDVGKADGILGPATRVGVRAFQASKGLVADGYPTQETVDAAKGDNAD